MKKLFFIKTVLLLAAVAVLPLNGAVKNVKYDDKELAYITKRTVEVLSTRHYRARRVTPELAKQFFDSYITMLDRSRLFLTQADVESLKIPPEKLAQQLLSGDNTLAFRVYNLYKKRHAQYCAFAEELLKKPLDFTIDESIDTKRDKKPRCKNETELREEWRKQLKNDCLFYRLFAKAMSSSKDPKDKKLWEDQSRWNGKSPEERVLKRLRDTSNRIKQREKIDILSLYLNALTDVYGPHSNYAAPRQAEDFDIAMSLSLSGIGATLTSDDGFIKIVSLTPGGPAEKGGKLKVNDRIISVIQENGETVDVIDMPVEKAVQYIRGKVGTKVTLVVLPGSKGRNAVPQRITITRAKIALVDQAAKGEIRIVNGKKIGIINLPSFYMDFEGVMRGDTNARRCSVDVFKILIDFSKQNVESVVMDLRRNGGGSLPEAIKLSGLFMPTGPVVQHRKAGKQPVLEIDDLKLQNEWTKPLVILISKGSASASEIFAAAMRDNNRAIIVGDSRTFGKGTILQVYDLDTPDFGGYSVNLPPEMSAIFAPKIPHGTLTYETEMFYRISGGSVQQLGVRSDIRIPSIVDEMRMGEMFFDNHLPWDEIAAVGRIPLIQNLDGKIEQLKKKSADRIAKSQEFQKMIKRIALYREYRKRTSISLNEEKRWQEYLSEKQFTEEEEEALIDDDNKKKERDPVLQEAAAIAADWVDLEK